MQSVIVIALIVVIAFFIFHQYYPNFLLEGFADAPKKEAKDAKKEEKKPEPKKEKKEKFADHEGFEAKKEAKKEKFQDGEGFADLHAFEGPAQFGSAESPSGCYPRDQLTPSELMPKDLNSTWAEQNPMGVGSLKGKNFLSAGALIGVNTVGQSLRNSNLQLRSEPPNPQGAVSIWNTSTIPPDTSHRSLEIGSSL
jgi:hypothetical protein